MRYYFFILLLVFTSCPLYSQYVGSDKVDESKVVSWNVKSISEYKGVYHFGYSEGESELILIIDDNKCYGQIKEGGFSEDGKSFIWHFKNLTDVKIKGNKFFSKEANGQFVIYSLNNKKEYGLKILKPWSMIEEKGAYEIGTRLNNNFSNFNGKYIDGSTKHLTKKDLEKLNKQDIQIMRNEIFARYGYIFKSGGEMEKYFSKESWYKGQHKNINPFLTDLEKKNVKLMMQIEKNKSNKK